MSSYTLCKMGQFQLIVLRQVFVVWLETVSVYANKANIVNNDSRLADQFLLGLCPVATNARN